MWFGKDVAGNFQDQFEVLCGLEQMIHEEVMTKYEVHCELEQTSKNAVMT
jgi:hypothetical protein